MDSHVLLHAAAELLHDRDDVSLRAIHVNHGLHADSEFWVRHAEFVCDGLNIPLVVRKVVVDEQFEGPEAGARLARYEAFSNVLEPGEQLLLAQHADDQAETFLLQALRGSGPDGLSSIPRKRTFGTGFMVRPLLTCAQQDLADYAQSHGLSWIDDPSNADTRYDRNFLRAEVLPLLHTRWPAATKTLSRSAMRSAAACQTLHDVALEDLDLVRVRGSSELSISALKALPRERVYGAVRLWVRHAGLRMPRLQDLRQVVSDLMEARDDSVGVVNVRDYEFRRHRDKLFLVLGQVEPEPFSLEWDAPFDDLLIGQTGQLLSKKDCLLQGLQLPDQGSITVRSRVGGELIKLGEPAFHKAVKKVLQEAAVPPWQRDSIPLLYVNGRLAAIWNVVVAVDFKAGAELA
ncbi:UNVERIFIED_CONTAM: hypothetical protein GTU68_006489 [Idotea baltica]|nr:hypothetical protein [Idotea baltica]